MNRNLITLIFSMAILWFACSFALLFAGRDLAFHLLNAAGVSAALVTIGAYAPVVWDSIKNRRLFPGHVLAMGVCTNWLGFIIRIIRWFGPQGHNAPPPHEWWLYSFGIVVSLTGALLLIGALALQDPQWPPRRLLAHIGIFLVLTFGLWQLDHTWW